MGTKNQIQNIITISDLQYGNTLMDAAYSYLSAYLYGNKECVRVITLTRSFWQWWENQWDKRNREYLNMLEVSESTYGEKTQTERYKMWLKIHNIYPDKLRISQVILDKIDKERRAMADEEYDAMINYVIKNEVNAFKL